MRRTTRAITMRCEQCGERVRLHASSAEQEPEAVLCDACDKRLISGLNDWYEREGFFKAFFPGDEVSAYEERR